MNVRRLFSTAALGGLLALCGTAATFVAPADFPSAGPARVPAPPVRIPVIVPLQATAVQPPAPTLRLEGAAAHWDFLPARPVAGRRAGLPAGLSRP